MYDIVVVVLAEERACRKGSGVKDEGSVSHRPLKFRATGRHSLSLLVCPT